MARVEELRGIMSVTSCRLTAGPLLLGVLLVAATLDICEGATPRLPMLRPPEGSSVGLEEVVAVSVIDPQLWVTVLARASYDQWWVQADSSQSQGGEVSVTARFGEPGVGLGRIYEIVAVGDPGTRFTRGQKFVNLPPTAFRSPMVRVRKTHD